MNRTRAAFYSFLWVGGGTVLANLFGYLLRILLARNLTVAEYGLVYAVMALFGLVSILVHWGLGEALTRESALVTGTVASVRRLKEAFNWSVLILYGSAGTLAVLSVALSRWLADVWFHNPAAAAPVAVYALAVVLSTIGYVFPTVAAGRGRADMYTAFFVSQSVSLLVFAWLLLPYGATGVLLAYGVTMGLMNVLFLPLLHRMVPGFWRVHARLRAVTLRRLVRYGVPVMITGLAWMVLANTDTALLTVLTSLEMVGQYQAAQPTANLLLFLNTTLLTVLLPLLTDLWRRRKRQILAASLHDLYVYVFIAVLPLVIALAVFPDIVLNLLFGATYVPAAPILRWLVGSALFVTLNAVTVAAFSSMGVPRRMVRAVFIGAIFNVIANFLLIPRFGGTGAAFATFLSAGTISVIGVMSLRDHLSVRLPWGRWIKGVVSGVAFALVLVLCRALLPIAPQIVKVVVSVGIAGAVYALALFATRAVTMDEIRALSTRILSARGGSL